MCVPYVRSTTVECQRVRGIPAYVYNRSPQLHDRGSCSLWFSSRPALTAAVGTSVVVYAIGSGRIACGRVLNHVTEVSVGSVPLLFHFACEHLCASHHGRARRLRPLRLYSAYTCAAFLCMHRGGAVGIYACAALCERRTRSLRAAPHHGSILSVGPLPPPLHRAGEHVKSAWLSFANRTKLSLSCGCAALLCSVATQSASTRAQPFASSVPYNVLYTRATRWWGNI